VVVEPPTPAAPTVDGATEEAAGVAGLVPGLTAAEDCIGPFYNADARMSIIYHVIPHVIDGNYSGERQWYQNRFKPTPPA